MEKEMKPSIKYKVLAMAAVVSMMSQPAFADRYSNDNSVHSSIFDQMGVRIKFPDMVRVSNCGSPRSHESPQGKNLKPSNECRVINYYYGKKFAGAVRVPIGEPFRVPWSFDL